MILAALAAAMPLAPSSASAPRTDTVIYVVRSGDTLDELSRDFLVDGRRWHSLLRLARVSDPRRLPVGQKLVIPRSWLRYRIEPARLASYRGNVSISVGGVAAAPKVGMTISEGTQISTAANSFVTLVLGDRSRIVLPSQSRVRMRQLRRILLTGAIDYRIETEQGRLETKVAPLDRPTGRYRIETPVSMTAVRGTEFRVAFEPSSAISATTVLEGSVALSADDGGEAQLLDPGFGATLDGGGKTRVENLLAAPELADPGAIQTGDSVAFRVHSVAGAARYRVVVASDAGFVENITEQLSDGGTFSLADVPNGNLFVRVSAIAPSGLEGLSQAYGFRRRLASIRAAVDAAGDAYRFRWSGAGEGERRYRFQLLREGADAVPLVDQVGLEEDSLTLRNLPPGVYYWRVGVAQVEAGETTESWSEPEKLTIAETTTRGQGR